MSNPDGHPTPDLTRLGSSGLVVRPGDTLLVAVDADISPAAADALGESILRRLPTLADVVVITRCTALAAYRPDQHPWGTNG
jgi:hypothetical protein